MTTHHRSDLLRSLESGYSLPSLSAIAMRLVEMASDEMCSVDDLAALIEQDPSLAVRLLRLANSAFFQSGYPAVTLKQAIVRIGFERLRIMGLSLSLRDTFPMGRTGPMDYEKFWRSSLYQAFLAQSFARRTCGCDSGEAFVAGLTLEIGLLVFFDVLMRKDQHVIADLDLHPVGSLLSWEREHYGTNHREVGEAALRYWKFPDTIVDCQRCHDMKSWQNATSALPKICRLAGEFSALMCQNTTDLHTPFRMAEESFGLDHEAVNDILVTALQHVDQMAETLKVEVNRERDIIGLMEKANRALSVLSEKLSTGQYHSFQQPLPSFESLSEEAKKEPAVAHTLQAVAHEIRNPLMAVGEFAKRLASTLDPQSEGGRYVRIILKESQRLEQALHHMIEE